MANSSSETSLYLRLDCPTLEKPIHGGSFVAGREGCIDIESLDWGGDFRGVRNTPKSPPKLRSVTVSKFMDGSSLRLMSVAQARTPFTRATVYFADWYLENDSDGGRSILEMRLTNGCIEDMDISVESGDISVRVKEKLKLSFSKIDIIHYPAGANRARVAGSFFNCRFPSKDK